MWQWSHTITQPIGRYTMKMKASEFINACMKVKSTKDVLTLREIHNKSVIHWIYLNYVEDRDVYLLAFGNNKPKSKLEIMEISFHYPNWNLQEALKAISKIKGKVVN
jgi:hypothetical protein